MLWKFGMAVATAVVLTISCFMASSLTAQAAPVESCTVPLNIALNFVPAVQRNSDELSFLPAVQMGVLPAVQLPPVLGFFPPDPCRF